MPLHITSEKRVQNYYFFLIPQNKFEKKIILLLKTLKRAFYLHKKESNL